MQFPALRRYIKSKNLQEPYSLKDRELVIDGNSFFKDSYKHSGCQFVLGPDSDSYADYLISKLSCFLDCNIKCHVIFKGISQDTLEKRQETHQTTIDDRNNIQFNLNNPKYFDPLLVNDIQKQVLEEMGIKYFCCEYDSVEAIVGVARGLKCPVLTDNIEYCLFKVSCILPKSIVYNDSNKELLCTMYEHHKHQALCGVFIKTPVLLTLLTQNKDFLNNIPDLSHCAENDDVPAVIRWVKGQHKDLDASKIFKDENTRKAFLEIYQRIKIMYLYPSNNLAVNYFRRAKPYKIFKDDKKWFAKGVSDGRIGLPYVEMKRKGFFTGSRIVNVIHKSDAVLAAGMIIAYNQLLTNSRKTPVNFIGRKNKSCSIWEFDTDWQSDVSRKELFDSPKGTVKYTKKLYSDFFEGVLPGHDLINILVKIVNDSDTCVPQDCWVLLITLVYYIENVNEDFIDGVYFIILSYLLLGPVSKTLHEFKEKSDKDVDIKYKSAQKMNDEFSFLFRKVDLNHNYNTSILHSLAEFLHCLQHMNYLNNLCGRGYRNFQVPSTVYQDTYNATFVYNAFIIMRNKSNLMTYLKENLDESNVFVNLFNDIVSAFEKCRNPSPDLLIEWQEKLQMQFFKLIKSMVHDKGIVI